jgi:glycosyltransferase involved in cell wall biosynthesis
MNDERRSVRVYLNLRSAHLERFGRMQPAEILFRGTRYDYDASLAPAGLVLRRASRRAAIADLARTPYRVVEVIEPHMTNGWSYLLAQIFAIRLRGLLSRRPERIVTYCIGNADPALEISRRWRLPLPVARVVTRLMLKALVASMDRLAFGTTGSRQMYEEYVGAAGLESRSRLFDALPAPCECLAGAAGSRSATLVFVGAFAEHKGIRQVLAAWDDVARQRDDVRLHLIGKGRLADEVTQWAATRAEVRVDIDPPRSVIHDALRSGTALILASQRQGHWREQIGLPILEGLAHGCEIITTTETGLADWLAAHGHVVLESDAGSDLLTVAILKTFAHARPSARLLADLPATDGRIEADRWLMC